jgi:hypothetical protein
MDKQYHIIYDKQGQEKVLIATEIIADALFRRDLTIGRMTSFLTLEELLDCYFNSWSLKGFKTFND